MTNSLIPLVLRFRVAKSLRGLGGRLSAVLLFCLTYSAENVFSQENTTGDFTFKCSPAGADCSIKNTSNRPIVYALDQFTYECRKNNRHWGPMGVVPDHPAYEVILPGKSSRLFSLKDVFVTFSKLFNSQSRPSAPCKLIFPVFTLDDNILREVRSPGWIPHQNFNLPRIGHFNFEIPSPQIIDGISNKR